MVVWTSPLRATEIAARAVIDMDDFVRGLRITGWLTFVAVMVGPNIRHLF